MASIQNAEVIASEPCPICPSTPPPQCLVTKREKLRPAAVFTLGIQEPFHLLSGVDPLEHPDIVECRHRLSRLKDVASFSFLPEQVQDTTAECGAQVVEGWSATQHGTRGGIVGRDRVGVPLGGSLHLAFADQGLQPSLGILGLPVVAEGGQ